MSEASYEFSEADQITSSRTQNLQHMKVKCRGDASVRIRRQWFSTFRSADDVEAIPFEFMEQDRKFLVKIHLQVKPLNYENHSRIDSS